MSSRTTAGASRPHVAVIGGGFCGLAAAWELGLCGGVGRCGMTGARCGDQSGRREVELTRFRGPLPLWGGGIHHAEIETAPVSAEPAPAGSKPGQAPPAFRRQMVDLVRTGRGIWR